MSESCGENLTLWLTNLTHCNPGVPPYNVNVTYGNNTWTLWKNGTSTSTLEPKCISDHSLTCQANGTMAELRLYLNASVEGCQNLTLSTVEARYDRAIQRPTSIEGLLIPSVSAFFACAYELMLRACAYELMQYYLFLVSIAVACPIPEHQNTPNGLPLAIIVSFQFNVFYNTFQSLIYLPNSV